MSTDHSPAHTPLHALRANTRQADDDPSAAPLLPESMSDAIITELDEIGGMLGSISAHLNEPPGTDDHQPHASQALHAPMFAHEVNNLMTQVGGRAQLALLHPDRSDLAIKALELASCASTQVAQLAEIFLNSDSQHQAHDLSTSIEAVHNRALGFLADEDIHALGFTFQTHPTPPTLAISPLLLQQVLLNLYLNAISAIKRSQEPDMAPHTHVITTRVQWDMVADQCSTWNTSEAAENRLGQCVQIVVEDNGPGMTPEQIQHALNPSSPNLPACSENPPDPQDQGATNHTHSRSSTGHGLGLAVCQMLITNASGCLNIQSTTGQGTKVIITLPCTPKNRTE